MHETVGKRTIVTEGAVAGATAAAASAAPAPAAERWPAARTAWYTMFVLALSVLFANLDQNILSLLVEPIKRDLGLSDTAMGLLLGPAFVLFYTFIGIPVARFIDRNSRKLILALGLAAWSLATACCGLAQGFGSLFLARVGVGAGEAVNQPATFSLIADSFRKERLPRAIAVMQLGVTAGAALAYYLGSVVIASLAHVPPLHVHGIGVIRSWQLVFVAVGLPGLAVALLMATTLREPPRHGLEAQDAVRLSLLDVLGYLRTHWRVFAPMFLGLTFGALSLGAGQWLAAFLHRTYGWDVLRIGSTIGAAQIIAMPIGLLIGVWLAEHFDRRHYEDAPLRVVVIAGLIRVPASIAMPLMPAAWLAVACQALIYCTVGIGGASQNAALQIITPNRMRGQVTALYLFTFNVIGFGLGPLLTGFITDHIFHAESDLRYALVLLSAIVAPLSLVFVWLGIRPYVREVARLKSLALI